ncbi:unnamed protein product [Amoebophrya sp. A25]|nr:unnamed protein product [Amoebophrya sp. A25]|eukprot:GSA25T00022177001.1
MMTNLLASTSTVGQATLQLALRLATSVLNCAIALSLLFAVVSRIIPSLLRRTSPQTKNQLRSLLTSDAVRNFFRESLSHTMCSALGPSLVAASRDPATCDAAGRLFLSPEICLKLETLSGRAVGNEDFRQNFVKLANQVSQDPEIRKHVGQGIIHTILDEDVRYLMREIFLCALEHQNLHSAVVKAVRAGFTAAVQDEELALIGKQALIEILSDSQFHRAILKGALGAVKEGVKDAMLDSKLQQALKSTLVDALQDEELHKATMQGAFDAMIPDVFSKIRIGEMRMRSEGERAPPGSPEGESDSPPGGRAKGSGGGASMLLGGGGGTSSSGVPSSIVSYFNGATAGKTDSLTSISADDSAESSKEAAPSSPKRVQIAEDLSEPSSSSKNRSSSSASAKSPPVIAHVDPDLDLLAELSANASKRASETLDTVAARFRNMFGGTTPEDGDAVGVQEDEKQDKKSQVVGEGQESRSSSKSPNRPNNGEDGGSDSQHGGSPGSATKAKQHSSPKSESSSRRGNSGREHSRSSGGVKLFSGNIDEGRRSRRTSRDQAGFDAGPSNRDG